MRTEDRTFPLSRGSSVQKAMYLGYSIIAVATSIGIVLLVMQNMMMAFVFMGTALITAVFLWDTMTVPMKFRVGPSGVTVARSGGDIVISPDDIKEIRQVDSKEFFRGAVSPYGCEHRVGGRFWIVGTYYSNKDYGAFEACASRDTKLVLIVRTNDKPIVISPDDPEGFVEAVRELLRFPVMGDLRS